MTIRFYLMPAVIEDINGRLTKHPKYDSLYTGRDSHIMDYGREDIFFTAIDVSAEIHTALTANSDVDSFPVNITNQIGAAFTTVETRADALHIPLIGLGSSSTYRQLLRRIALVCLFGQCIEGARFRLFTNPTKVRLFTGQLTLNSTFGDLTEEDQSVLLEAFNSFGFNVSSLTLVTTLRQIIRAFVLQWRGEQILMLGVPL